MPKATGLSQSLTDALTADNERRERYAHRQAAKNRARRHRSAVLSSSSASNSSIGTAAETERR
jgi:hypothetical protein